MIYIENKDGVQRVVIPTNDTNVEYVNFVPQEGDSDYYTKEQTDEKISQSSTAVLGEIGDWLSHYATTDYVHDAVENVTVDLTGYATEQWVKDQNYTTDEWVLQQNYATEDYVDAEIQKIPKPDMSDYYTKQETDDKIDNALLNAPLMLEHAGFATQNWVKDRGYATKQYVDDAVANVPTGGGGSGDMSDYYTKGEIDTVKDDLQGQITDNKNAIKGLDSRVENIELNGGSATVDWDNVPYMTVNGFAVFNREVQFNAGGDNTDISSGIECAFKTGRSQSVEQWTKFIHAGTDGDNIYFVDADGYNRLAMIDTAGNIYEGMEMLSDKYATKAYVDDLIININNTLSNI